MKIVAMIPARIGSKRVPQKNLRLLNEKPLIQYIIDTAKGVDHFSKIYLNADNECFHPVAENSNISFYLRPKELGSDSATNDEFALDFLENVKCDVLIQLLPTSPFVTATEITNFIESMLKGHFETFISVKRTQIACLFNDQPINFHRSVKNPPSQEMTPIMAYATAIMGWTSVSFKKNMKTLGCAYHGGEGRIGYFELRGFSTIDIDHEEDFVLADAIMSSMHFKHLSANQEPLGEKTHTEVDVYSILKRDGVVTNNLEESNREILNVDKLIQKKSSFGSSWSYRVINTENNSMTVIAQNPGEGNREHYHPNWNEWWYILDGSWKWIIEGKERVVTKGDVVFIPKGKKHQIVAIGDKLAIRMAVSRADVEHVYTQSGSKIHCLEEY